jgi:enoyl-CoA hydratase/carnithine racemase
MSTVRIEHSDDGVCRLIICNGRGNPITAEFVSDFNIAMDQLISKPPRALVIDADGAKIFSGGFALPIIADWERDTLWAFFSNFLTGLHKIMTIECPTITAIEGHAIAGGFILSLASDFRVIGSGRLKLGLSEVDLGVAVPAGVRTLLEARTSTTDALWLSCTGELISPQRAEQIKLATVLDDNPLQRAMTLATQLAKKPGQGAAVTHQLANAPILTRMKAETAAGKEAFLDSWFSEHGQQCIQALAAKLRS